MKHSLSVFAVLLGIFLAAQLVGLFVVHSYVDTAASEKATQETGKPVTIYGNLPYGVERPQIDPETSYIFLASAIIIGTLLLLLIMKFRKQGLWKVWFFLATVITLTVAFSAFMPKAIGGILALVIAYFKVFKPNIVAHNLGELFIYGGLAAIFVPVLSLRSAVILLLIIAAYDVFAVFQSKHMISLAKFQTSNKIFAGLLIPKDLSAKTAFSQVGAPLPSTVKGKPAKASKTGEYADSGSYAVVGGGDIGFPLLFAGAAMATLGFSRALIIPFFATAALAVLMIIGKKGKFYPAMPFVAAGCFVGYGIAQLI